MEKKYTVHHPPLNIYKTLCACVSPKFLNQFFMDLRLCFLHNFFHLVNHRNNIVFISFISTFFKIYFSLLSYQFQCLISCCSFGQPLQHYAIYLRSCYFKDVYIFQTILYLITTVPKSVASFRTRVIVSICCFA